MRLIHIELFPAYKIQKILISQSDIRIQIRVARQNLLKTFHVSEQMPLLPQKFRPLLKLKENLFALRKLHIITDRFALHRSLNIRLAFTVDLLISQCSLR